MPKKMLQLRVVSAFEASPGLGEIDRIVLCCHPTCQRENRLHASREFCGDDSVLFGPAFHDPSGAALRYKPVRERLLERRLTDKRRR